MWLVIPIPLVTLADGELANYWSSTLKMSLLKVEEKYVEDDSIAGDANLALSLSVSDLDPRPVHLSKPYAQAVLI